MPEMNLREFKKQLKENNFSNLYLLHGEEIYLIERYTDMLIKSILNNGISDFNFMKFDGTNLNMSSFEDFIYTFSLSNGKKCALINNLNTETLSAGEFNKLTAIISDIPSDITIVMKQTLVEFNKKKTAKYNKLLNNIKKHGICLELKKLSDSELKKYIIKFVNSKGSSISEENAINLIRSCGTDILSLNQELNKLCAFKMNQEINSDDIELLTLKTFETNVFELVRSIISGEYNKAYNQLNSLFYKNENPISIVSVLSLSYIDIFRVKAVPLNLDIYSLTEIFDYKRKEFRIKKASQYAKRLSTEQINLSLEELIKADTTLKSTTIDPKFVIEKLIAKLLLISKRDV